MNEIITTYSSFEFVSPIIKSENHVSSCLTFHNTEFPSSLLEEKNTLLMEREHFGVLEIDIPKEKISSDLIWDIVFSIDNSGSMSDFCSDHRCKMEHIKHTLSNILRLFSTNKEIEFNVYVQTFNDEIKEVIDFTAVTEENVDILIQKINKIYEESSTNLRLPLEKSRIKIKERQKNYPKHNYVHIELTDGDDTCGNNEYILKENMCNEYKNIFIGFGKDHNSILLDTLANNNKNEYRFIDKIESAGLVYGEIIHNLMYMKYPEVEIKINNGKIYNWRKNEWVDNMFIGSLASGLVKTFHVKSETPSIVDGVLLDSRYQQDNILNEFTIHDTDMDENNGIICDFSTLPNLIDEDSNIIVIDHTKYMYRQRIHELLYESKVCYSNKLNRDRKKEFKIKLKSFFEKMKEYIQTKNLENDVFWKVLLDDVYVAYKTIDSQYSYLYTNSRQTSQGMQQTYAVNNLEGLDLDKDSEDYADSDDFEDVSLSDELSKTIKNCFPTKKRFFKGNRNRNEGCCPSSPISPKDELKHKMLDNTETSYSNNEILDLMKTINYKK